MSPVHAKILDATNPWSFDFKRMLLLIRRMSLFERPEAGLARTGSVPMITVHLLAAIAHNDLFLIPHEQARPEDYPTPWVIATWS